MRKHGAWMVLIIMSIFISGCAQAVYYGTVGAAKAASLGLDAASTTMKAKSNLDKYGQTKATPDRVWDSAIMALDDLGVEVEDKKFDGKEGVIKGKAGKLEYIRVYVAQEKPNLTDIGIQSRTALVPWDQNGYDLLFADEIMKRINDYLTGKATSTKVASITVPQPSGQILNVNQYFSFKQGNKKTFKLDWEANRKQGQIQLTRTVLEARDLKGKQVIPIKDETVEKKISIQFIADENDGIVVFARQTQDMTEPEIRNPVTYIVKKPCQVGSSWEHVIHTSLLTQKTTIPGKAFIHSINDTVLVPAGEYKNCLRLVTFGTLNTPNKKKIEVEAHEWYAPEIGWIKSIVKEKSNDSGLGFGGTITIQMMSVQNI